MMAYSCIAGMQAVSKYRYAAKDANGNKLFEHPYRPWDKKLAVPDEGAHYRAFKANENQREWFTYSLPFLFIFSAYGGALPWIGKFTPHMTLGAAILWSHFNAAYAKGYAKSASGRMYGWKGRVNAFKFLFVGSLAAVACVAGRKFGLPIPN